MALSALSMDQAQQLVSRRKTRTGTTSHSDANRVIDSSGFQRMEHFPAQFIGTRIALFDAIERDTLDVFYGTVDNDFAEFH